MAQSGAPAIGGQARWRRCSRFWHIGEMTARQIILRRDGFAHGDKSAHYGAIGSLPIARQHFKTMGDDVKAGTVRFSGMAQRARDAAVAAKAETDSYIREAAGRSPAQEIADAKALLEAGAITQAEFDSLKAKALA